MNHIKRVMLDMYENAPSRRELVHVTVRLSFVSVVSYYSVRWLMYQLDPSIRQRDKHKGDAQNKMKRLQSSGTTSFKLSNLTEHEVTIASHIIVPEDIEVSWGDIAGIESLVQDIRETVILPIRYRHLFANSQLTTPPRGVLLHGPPGCGKTMIAKATAKEAGMFFINLDVSLLTDKWYGESQKLASAVFSLAVKLQPCIVFIDEIDSFLRSRTQQDHEATAMMKAQFMTLWDGLATDRNCLVIIMGATNRPQDLDRAILRRMPASFRVPMPSAAQRKKILQLICEDEPLSSNVDLDKLATLTIHFSGSDLKEVCRKAAVQRVRGYMKLRESIRTFGAQRDPLLHQKMSFTDADGNENSSSVNMPTTSESAEEFHDALEPITQQHLMTAYKAVRDSKWAYGTTVLDMNQCEDVD